MEPLRRGDVRGVTHGADGIGLQLRWRPLANEDAVLMRVSISPRDDHPGSKIALRVESRERESQGFETAAASTTRRHA